MVTTTLRTTASLFGMLGALALAPSAAFAQQQDSESYDEAPIIVTAQRRAEAQVDVPISVTTLGADQLQTSNVQQLPDIVKVTPGLRFDNAGAFFQPTIRGIGTAVTTSGGGGNVGIYIDGFYSPNPLATNMQLLNVSSIQVLKGPQGTLFGRNTTGGAILIQSQEPSTDTHGQVKVSYGRYNEARAQGYLTYGISDTVAMDFEGNYSRGSGWQHDISSGKRVGKYENWSTRIGLKADLSDAVSVLIRYQHNDADDPRPLLTASYTGPDIASGAPFFAQPGQYTFRKNQIATGSVGEFFRSNSDVVQGTIKADLGFADFTSYSQYRKEDVDASLELDYSGVDVFQLGLPNHNETWSQEFLLNSKPGTPLQWTAGLFYFQNRDTYVTLIDSFRVGLNNRIRLGGSSTTTKSYAAFVDATYEVTPQLFVTAGVRYAKDKVGDAYWNTQGLAPSYQLADGTVIPAPNGVVPVPGISDDRVTPRFVIRYKPDDQSSIYASYTKGYKAAIIDVGGSCQTAATDYRCNNVRPETIDAFEVGYKYDDRSLSFELSGFYYDYKDLQVSIFRTGTAEIINAAKSEIYGLDGQLRYRLSSNFEVNLGGAWTHARYKTFNSAPVYTPCVNVLTPAECGANGVSFVVVPTQLRNVTMQRTPEFTGNLGARYKTDLAGGELSLSGNLFYSSKFYFGPSGIQFPQKGYETLSLRAQWTDPSDTYTIALWGDNVTNSRYKTQVQYASFGLGTNWSQPTTFGVELGAKF
jgi:iron complex outermembrane receptor protein